jgi:hypothetical protein
MAGIVIYIVGFGLMGAMFFGLRYWDKRRRAQLPPPSSGNDAGEPALVKQIEEGSENVQFFGGAILRALTKGKPGHKDRDGPGDSDGGGSDGGSDGGGDGGGG